LRMTRDKGPDHKTANNLFEKVYKTKKANWYFRSRGALGQAELILYHEPKKINQAIKLCDESLKLLEERPKDYFTLKTKIVKAEILTRRDKKGDLVKATNLCKSVYQSKTNYKDLVARAKLAQAEIVKNPKAAKLYQDVLEMEGLDPYIIEKVNELKKSLKKGK